MALQTVHKGYGGKATFTVLASAARTADTTSDDFTVPYGKQLTLIISATASAATPSVVPTIRGVSAINGTVWDVLVGSAITGTGTTVLKVGPGIGQVANGAAADYLPETWRVFMDAADADSLTYSIEAEVS